MATQISLTAVLCMLGMANSLSQAQQAEHAIPSIVHKDGRYALLVDGSPFFMLGVQANNSSAWPATLPKAWAAVDYVHANTLEIPIYWEQFEPKHGQFDYSLIDAIIGQARSHGVRLVLLWFGTWKNGSQHYMPEWMKRDPERYFHVVDKNGRPVDSPSPFAAASLEADERAFTAFMRHLKATDPQRTVLMVQVENESGTWGTLRDYSPAAQKLFEARVPAEIMKAMDKPVGADSGNWQDVFGPEAEVCFHAWSVARYVGKVAAAGKAVYPLPLYANAALRDPLKPGAPGSYESGGPTDNVLPIWKAAAPAIDILAPDIYMSSSAEYLKVLDLYHRNDNPLFIPETIGSQRVARFLFSALGRQALGFSPFGLDYTRTGFPQMNRVGPNGRQPGDPNEFLIPTAENYQILGPMMRDVARLNFEGKLQAIAEESGTTSETLHFGSWDAIVSYGAVRNGPAKGNAEPIGRALVAQLEANTFLVAGMDCRVDFRPTDPNKRRQFLRVGEGIYEHGAFKFQRILNGDQTDWGINLRAEPIALQVTVDTY
ncbi:MAG: DUF5597 domain-containing protein [Bryobacteraceae bacterium]